jgi:hypothetical protein
MQPNSISVVDIRIPFWRLVAFFIKAAIAAIPAAIAVAILYYLIALLFFGALLAPWGRH